jgi:hypothetical protein
MSFHSRWPRRKERSRASVSIVNSSVPTLSGGDVELPIPLDSYYAASRKETGIKSLPVVVHQNCPGI